MIKDFILVGIGGALGSITRYAIKLLAIYINLAGYYGTIAANIIGSFLIGVTISSVSDRSWGLFLTVGFMGGFTTFSTFSSETVSMIQNGENLKAVGYIIATLSISLLATYIGLLLGKKI